MNAKVAGDGRGRSWRPSLKDFLAAIKRNRAPIAKATNNHRTQEQMAAIRSFYELQDDVANTEYLEGNAAVRGIMAEAVTVIPRFFPDHRRVTTDLTYDYDTPGHRFLSVRIDTGVGWLQARELREQFDNDWWLAQYRRAGDKLHFDVEYNQD